ncbi:MAG: formylglycine-generating enzyme family protein [Treponema sp.]|jgi:formylglycine-generating enzyme required for sulfatase activity|nr:formylglycine-generating enzyme family protein [Treponema sp.]
MKRNFIFLFAGIVVCFVTACVNAVPKGMAAIPGGTFIMGSPETDPDYVSWEGPQHSVTLDPFYMGIYTVTQQEYEAVIGNNPSHLQTGNYPVETVSWYAALEYCNALSKKHWLKPAYVIGGDEVAWNPKANGYRLPTEAEWEYACRAGTATYYNTGDTIALTDARFYAGAPVAVGSFAPNVWGLYDMHGNVYEWCWDWYGDYPAEPAANPRGPESGTRRIIRGGSAASDAQHLRSAERGRVEPSVRNANLGFRIVRNVR